MPFGNLHLFVVVSQSIYNVITAKKSLFLLSSFGRVEQSVYALLRTRDMAISRYREFGIPVDWLSDTGVVGKV